MTSRSDKCAVMMSYVRYIGNAGRVWHILSAPTRAEKVDRAEAEDYIESHGLVPAIETEDGIIWDTPGRDFRKAFRGWIKENYERFYRRWGL